MSNKMTLQVGRVEFEETLHFERIVRLLRNELDMLRMKVIELEEKLREHGIEPDSGH